MAALPAQGTGRLDRQAPDMFMKVDGLTGESTDMEYTGWAEIISFSWGVEQPAGSHGVGGASSERANFADFTVTKAVDKMSPKLMVYCARGQHVKEVKIHVRRPVEKQRLYEVVLSDVVVAGVHQDAHPGGFAGWLPVETVRFNFAKINWTFTECDHRTSRAKGDHKGGWDLKTNRESL